MSKQITEVKEFPGLLECAFKHDISKTTADFKWLGPKLDRAMWDQVLAFFKWTFDTSQSESQVRLFVNPREGIWKAWAFPQRANSGMSANEISNEAAAEQRRQFSPQDGWLYFGTVHHHCSASAFQSGTDEQNEKDQDGIHITVGFMNKGWYDIHERFYLRGYRLTPKDTTVKPAFKLSDLWEVQTDFVAAMNSVPEPLRQKLPDDALEKVARYEMGKPPASDIQFPEIWRENLIVETRVVSMPATTPTHYTGTQWNKFLVERCATNHTPENDYGRAMDRLNEYVQSIGGPTWEEINSLLKEMAEVLSDEHIEILDILSRNDFTPEAFLLRRLQSVQRVRALGEGKKEESALGKPTQEEIDEYWMRMQ